MFALGFGILYVPFYAELAGTIWATDEQGHGPIILILSAQLFYMQACNRCKQIRATTSRWLAHITYCAAFLYVWLEPERHNARGR